MTSLTTILVSVLYGLYNLLFYTFISIIGYFLLHLFIIVSSIFDKGHRTDGNIRNDLHSTFGALIAVIIYVYVLISV